MTQNIDNLESKTGLDMDKRVVQCHGANIGAHCSVCGKKKERSILDQHFKDKNVMRCQEKVDDDQICNGPVKPEITFFGEPLPKKYFWGCDRMRNRDVWDEKVPPAPLFEDGGCDLVIIMGTSMAVMPFSLTIMETKRTTPKVLINMHNTRDEGYDFDDLYNNPERLFIQGKCDQVVRKLVDDIGWTQEYDRILKNAGKM